MRDRPADREELRMSERGKDHRITFTVDGEEHVTSEKELTPNQIMAIAGIDAGSHYLVEIRGRHRESFEDRGDELIRLKDGMKFISVATGPTPVS
jgi:hypothetical protein